MKKRNKKTNLLLYKIYIYFLISCCLVSTPNNTRDKSNYEIGDIISKYNVAIIDKRDSLNPDIRIVDSYKINDINTMKAIINEIIEYNKNSNKYNWNRSEKTMLREWLVHNLCYYLGIMPENTASVDFNNSEESFYSLNLSKH